MLSRPLGRVRRCDGADPEPGADQIIKGCRPFSSRSGGACDMAWWNEGLMACLSETTWIADLPVAWDGTSREGNRY